MPLDVLPRFLVITVIMAPAILLAGIHFQQQNRPFLRAVCVQALMLYGLGEALAVSEPGYFLLTVFTIPFAFLNVINAGHFLLYRAPISASALSEIVYSSYAELFEFLASQRRLNIFFAALYLVLCLLGLVLLHMLAPPEQTFALPGVALFAALAIASYLRGNATNFYPVRYGILTFQAGRAMLRLRDHTESANRRRLRVHADPPPEQQKFLIVIGESVRRANLSLYGYERDTSPTLKAARDQMILFEDTVSPASQTRPSLECALTPAPLEDLEALATWKSIVTTAQDAGFETHWLSNQPRLDHSDTEVSVIAMEAEHKTFFNTEIAGRSTDGRMLPAIREAVATDRPSVIFIHMMGSHPRYEYRVEEEFRCYTRDSSYKNDPKLKSLIIDNYDNTIAYLDYFLGKVMEICVESNKPCLKCFFSDHGHVLFDDGASLFHGLANPLRKEFEIPYFYWPSPRFRERYPNNILFDLPPRVTGRAHLQYLFNDLALVMGLEFEDYDNPRTNLNGLSLDGPDKRRVIGRDTLYDFTSLP